MVAAGATINCFTADTENSEFMYASTIRLSEPAFGQDEL